MLLTADRSIVHQQNIPRSGVAVLITQAASNDIDDLVPLIPAILAALDTIQPGEIVEVLA